MKWTAKRDELGLTDADMSISVKKKIAKYNDLKETLAILKKNNGSADDIEVVQKGILELDTTLSKDMVRLADPAKKERYATMAARLPRKKAVTQKTTSQATVAADGTTTAVAPATTPPASTTPAQTTAQSNGQQTTAKKIQTPPSPAQPAAQKTAAAKKQEAKDDNTLLIIGGVILTGVLAFFGIRYYMKH